MPSLRDVAGLVGTAVGWTVVAAGWVVAAVLAGLTVLRLVDWGTAVEVLVVVDSLGALPALPAAVVAAGALVGRRWWMATVAGLVVATQLVLAAPELLAAAPLPSWAGHATTVRLLDANVDESPVFHAGYARAIERDRPDLVGMEEFSPGALQSMVAQGVLRAFPYRCAAPAYGVTGLLLASRWPLRGCRVDTVPWQGHPASVMVAATVDTPGGPVAVRVVHPIAPFPGATSVWHAALAAIDRSVRASGTRRMLVMGDFNSTWGNQGFRALLADGLVDGAAARGRALDMTWPNGAVVPPFVRIDHVLTGSGLAVTRIATHAGFGSDHRFLTATVAVRR